MRNGLQVAILCMVLVVAPVPGFAAAPAMPGLTDLAVSQDLLVLTPENGRLRVLEVVDITNTGTSPVDVLAFPVAAPFEQLQLLQGFDQANTIVGPMAWGDQRGLSPATTHQYVFSYEVPGFDLPRAFERSVTYDTATFRVLVPVDGPPFRSDTMLDDGQQTFGGVPLHGFRLDEVDAGTKWRGVFGVVAPGHYSVLNRTRQAGGWLAGVWQKATRRGLDPDAAAVASRLIILALVVGAVVTVSRFGRHNSEYLLRHPQRLVGLPRRRLVGLRSDWLEEWAALRMALERGELDAELYESRVALYRQALRQVSRRIETVSAAKDGA